MLLAGAPHFASGLEGDSDFAHNEPSAPSPSATRTLCALQCIEVTRQGNGNLSFKEDESNYTQIGTGSYWDSYQIEREFKGRTPLNDPSWQNAAFQVIAAKFPAFIARLRLRRDLVRAAVAIDVASKMPVEAFLTLSECKEWLAGNAIAMCSRGTTTEPKEEPPVVINH